MSNITTFTLTPDAWLYQADCRDVLRALPENSLDSCVCDPPYHLTSVVKRFGGANAAPAKHGTDGLYARQSRGFMQKTWDGGDIAFDPETWALVLRVLKPGAHLVAFGAPRGYHRMACAIEDAGFEIRDSLMWLFGTGFPKSQNVSAFIDKELGFKREKVRHAPRPITCGTMAGSSDTRPWIENSREIGYHEVDGPDPVSPQAIEFDGFGTALKPAFEPIILARKPLSEPTVAANVLRWRTGALNIDACRVGTEGGTRKERSDDKSVTTSVGGYLNAQAGELVPGMGRWPANCVTDGSEEVVRMFPNSKSTRSVVTSKPGDIYGGGKGLPSHTGVYGFNDSGSAARFFYSSKANKTDRAGSKHPTVKPVSLMSWLTNLVTPKGGVILDPFAGSGTTGQAALENGFKVILCERESEYVADIIRRIQGGSVPDRSPGRKIYGVFADEKVARTG